MEAGQAEVPASGRSSRAEGPLGARGSGRWRAEIQEDVFALKFQDMGVVLEKRDRGEQYADEYTKSLSRCIRSLWSDFSVNISI